LARRKLLYFDFLGQNSGFIFVKKRKQRYFAQDGRIARHATSGSESLNYRIIEPLKARTDNGADESVS